jgi:hypothetical protein
VEPPARLGPGDEQGSYGAEANAAGQAERHLDADGELAHHALSRFKNVVFWDIRTQFVLHRRHITSPLQGAAG